MTRSSLKSPRWFAVVGSTLLVLGLAAIGGGLLALGSSGQGPEHFQRMTMPVDRKLELAKGRHVIAYEHMDAYRCRSGHCWNQDRMQGALRIKVRRGKKSVKLVQSWNGIYRFPPHDGQYAWTFETPVAGKYRITADARGDRTYPPNLVLAVGRGAEGGVLWLSVLLFVFGGLSTLIGIGGLVVARERHKERTS